MYSTDPNDPNLEQRTLPIGAVVSREQAQTEIEGWLDFRKTPAAERAQKADDIESLVNAVMYGQISINPDTKVITQKLDFPIEGEKGAADVTEIRHRPRVRTGEFNRAMEGVNVKSLLGGITTATVAAITGLPSLVIEKLDSQDTKISRTIASFFM